MKINNAAIPSKNDDKNESGYLKQISITSSIDVKSRWKYGICVTFRRHITIFLNQIYENAEADMHNEIKSCYILLKILNWGGKGDYFLLMVQKQNYLWNFREYYILLISSITRDSILNRLADGYDFQICEIFNSDSTIYLF